MARAPLITLHGFLGSGADWDFLNPDWAPSFFDPGQSWVMPYEEWTRRFAEEVENCFPRKKPWIVGYSMGGRLAMHALAHRPELFSGGVVVSAHPGFGPGLSDAHAREQARLGGEGWARRFESDEAWEKVLSDWNSLGVLQNTGIPERPEASAAERRAYAKALRVWSVGLQEDLRPRLRPLLQSGKLHWIAGERDGKYAAIAREMAGESAWIVPGAGHRVPWDAREAFRERLLSWLETSTTIG